MATRSKATGSRRVHVMPEPDDSFGERLYISEMQLTKAHLAADVNLNDVADALSEWTWLLGEEWSALLVSAVGDVFLSSRAHAICRLDTGTVRSLAVRDSVHATPIVLTCCKVCRVGKACGNTKMYSPRPGPERPARRGLSPTAPNVARPQTLGAQRRTRIDD